MRNCFLLILTSLLFLMSCQSKGPTLHLYAWSDTIEPELIQQFEKQYGCKVIVDTYDSNESLYAKLKAGAFGYDLIFPSSYMVEIMAKQGMLSFIDPATIPNLRHLDQQAIAPLKKEILRYGVPFTITYSGIGYNRERIDHPIASWSMFGRRDLRSRMTMLNDMREVLGAALIFLGYSINSQNPAEIEAAADQVLQWKSNLAKFESEQYKNGIATAEYLLVQGYSGDILQIQEENPIIGFLIPEEGTVISLDCMAIPIDSSRPDLALAFVNFLYEPSHSALNTKAKGFLVPNLSSYTFLPVSLQKNPILFPDSSTLKKSEVIEDVGEAIRFYYKAWDRIKE